MAASSKGEVLDSFSVVPYDSDWDQRYEQERRALLDRLPSGFLELEHIGSTAVPGLDAKPIIDVMAAVAGIDHCESIVRSLEEHGYILIETGMRNRLFLRRMSAEGRIFHLHLVEASTWDSRRERLMRDYLRVHADVAAAYGRLKKKLAQECAGDSLAYTRRKNRLHSNADGSSLCGAGTPKQQCLGRLVGIRSEPGRRAIVTIAKRMFENTEWR